MGRGRIGASRQTPGPGTRRRGRTAGTEGGSRVAGSRRPGCGRAAGPRRRPPG